jgi:hypothetical protein
VFYQQGIKIVGKPIIFLVLGLGVYLEKLIVVAYEKCICPPWCSRGGKKVRVHPRTGDEEGR